VSEFVRYLPRINSVIPNRTLVGGIHHLAEFSRTLSHERSSELATELSIGQSALTAKDLLFNTSLRAPANAASP
jgi:hypothetical protein